MRVKLFGELVGLACLLVASSASQASYATTTATSVVTSPYEQRLTDLGSQDVVYVTAEQAAEIRKRKLIEANKKLKKEKKKTKKAKLKAKKAEKKHKKEICQLKKRLCSVEKLAKSAQATANARFHHNVLYV